MCLIQHPDLGDGECAEFSLTQQPELSGREVGCLSCAQALQKGSAALRGQNECQLIFVQPGAIERLQLHERQAVEIRLLELPEHGCANLGNLFGQQTLQQCLAGQTDITRQIRLPDSGTVGRQGVQRQRQGIARSHRRPAGAVVGGVLPARPVFQTANGNRVRDKIDLQRRRCDQGVYPVGTLVGKASMVQVGQRIAGRIPDIGAAD